MFGFSNSLISFLGLNQKEVIQMAPEMRTEIRAERSDSHV